MDAALRVTKGCVETAVWTLTHPESGRTVTLLGTIHIGSPAYFRDLSVFLAGLAAAGAEIHVEGISRRDDALTEWEEDRLAEADSWADPETTAAVESLRLESQSARLRLPDGTRNIDLSAAELLRQVGWNSYRRLFASQPSKPPPPGVNRLVRAVIRFQLRHGRALDGLRSLRPRNRQMNRVVIEERNQRAFAGGAEALTRGDAVLVWGTDHLPGLARRFWAAGFRPCRQQWFEACTI
jgi:hypothetical protein